MSSIRNDYQRIGDNTYNSIKDQYNYYNDRNTNNYNNERVASFQYTSNQNYRLTDDKGPRQSLQKIRGLRKTIHDVIDLCKGENADTKGEFNSVYGAEKEIYNLLLQNPQVLQKQISSKNIPAYTSQRFRKQNIATPSRPRTPYVPQSQYYIPGTQLLVSKQPNGQFQPTQQIQNPNSKRNPIPTGLSQDALYLIQQIQRKAFEQIQKLRVQNIELKRQLNVQIRNVNVERKKNMDLQALLVQNRAQRPDGSYQQANVTAQISRLQAELQRLNQINNSLRMQLNQKGTGLGGIEELLRQGELIRQDTIRLLRLKDQGKAQLETSYRQEQALTRQLTEEINRLKHKYQGTTSYNQNGRSNQSYTSYDRPQYSRVPEVGSNDQYGDLYSEMKRITGR